jgi:selenophosphate synthetase-related protein
MTNGQIAQLQELAKCHMATKGDKNFMEYWFADGRPIPCVPLNWGAKKVLRRLTHQYRHQIKAMKRNRVKQ